MKRDTLTSCEKVAGMRDQDPRMTVSNSGSYFIQTFLIAHVRYF